MNLIPVPEGHLADGKGSEVFQAKLHSITVPAPRLFSQVGIHCCWFMEYTPAPQAPNYVVAYFYWKMIGLLPLSRPFSASKAPRACFASACTSPRVRSKS